MLTNPISSSSFRRGLFTLVAFLSMSVVFLPVSSAEFWCYTPWNSCNATCQQVRSVFCASNDFCEDSLDFDVCVGALGTPVLVQNCFGDACLADWATGSWSACSTACGAGSQTRPVTCMMDGTVMADEQCDFGTRPSSSMGCTGWACTFVWTTGAWSACDVPCGDGTQVRTVSCVAVELGATVADAYCDAGLRPASTQGCFGASCAYAWEVGSWSACSVPCGEGTSERSVLCREAFTGDLVSDVYCTEVKPAVTQACEGTGCVYAWEPGDWGDCPAACGPGIQERAFVCVEATTGEVVEALWCAEARPTEVRLCEGTACTYEWRTSAWSECSVTCGGGFASRAIWCVEAETEVLVDAGLCDGPTEPAATMACNEEACPETFTWAAGDWGPCSAGCVDENPGVRTRALYCIDGGFAFVDPALCDPLLAPEATQACESDQACAPVEAKPGDGCSVSPRGAATPSGPRPGALLLLLLALAVLFSRNRRE